MLSYKELIKQNKAFADAHYVIKNFGNGERWQISNHSQDPSFKYPLMYVEDLANSSTDGSYTYSFKVWFVTRVEAPNDRGDEILYAEYANAKSDMIQCAQDLISFWVQDRYFPTMQIDKSVNIETFIDYDKDEFTGCSVTVNFVDAFNYDNCIIPMDGVPAPVEKVVTLTVNGDAFTTITCGTNYDVVVKDTDGAEVGSKVGSEWIVPAAGGDPVANTMNTVALTDAAAGTTKDFTIRYADDSAVVVTTISDSATAFVGEVPDPVTPTSSGGVYKTGADTSYNTGDDGDVKRGTGTDWYDLGYNNPFGNQLRFTGVTGGGYNGTTYVDVNGSASDKATEYPNDIMINWAMYNQSTETVTGLWFNPLASDRLIDHLSLSPFSNGGYSDWLVWNVNELWLFSRKDFNANGWLDYPPLSYVYAGTADRVWSSTGSPTIANYYYFYIGDFISRTIATVSYPTFTVRSFTLTELGL